MNIPRCSLPIWKSLYDAAGSKTEITIEKLDVDEEEYPCEWILEEAGPGACAALALYSVSEWYVEDHLCDAHRLATERRWKKV